MNERQQGIAYFLNHVYGYQRIKELLDGQKRKEERLRDFLMDTLIGTFRTTAVNQEMNGAMYLRVTRPGISKIYTLEEFMNRHHKEPKRLNFQYHMYNLNLFKDMSKEQVNEVVKERIKPCFPEARLITHEGPTKQQCWQFDIEAENFSAAIIGSSAHNSKALEVNFDAPIELVENINRTVSRYYGWLNSE